MLFHGINNKVSGSLLLRTHNRLVQIILAVFSGPGCRLSVACSTKMRIEAAAKEAFFFLHIGKASLARGFVHAHIYGNICTPDALKLADSRSSARFYPGVADNNGHSLEIHLRRFSEHHHRYAIIEQINHISVQNNLFALCCLSRHRRRQGSHAQAHRQQ